jgi:hypothetical protein
MPIFGAVVSGAISREEIYTALFALTSAAQFSTPILGLNTWGGFGRKYVDPAQIANEAMPFMAQTEGWPERFERPHPRLPPIRTLNVRLYCWARVDSGDTAELGSLYCTRMIEAVESALKPDAYYDGNDMLTLGGLVQHCDINGTVFKFTGDLDPQCMVSVPIRIIWP